MPPECWDQRCVPPHWYDQWLSRPKNINLCASPTQRDPGTRPTCMLMCLPGKYEARWSCQVLMVITRFGLMLTGFFFLPSFLQTVGDFRPGILPYFQCPPEAGTEDAQQTLVTGLFGHRHHHSCSASTRQRGSCFCFLSFCFCSAEIFCAGQVFSASSMATFFRYSN